MNVTKVEPTPVSVPTHELVKEAVEGARDLVKIEFALALDEVREDVIRLKRVAIWSGVTLVLANLLLATLMVALVLGLGGTAVIALALAGVLAVIAGVIAGVAYKLFPGAPLQRTRARVKNDVNQLREHVA
jgi:uncharacterized membrane protein YqjE